MQGIYRVYKRRASWPGWAHARAHTRIASTLTSRGPVLAPGWITTVLPRVIGVMTAVRDT